MLCVECGKREAKIGALCEVCYVKKTKFTDIPRHIDVVMCPHCHSVKFGGHWEEVSLEDAVYSLIDRGIKFLHEYDSYSLEVEQEGSEGEFRAFATVEVHYKGVVARELHEVLVDVKYESCPRCNRFFGNYFEAIVQLRGMREYEEKELTDFLRARVMHYSAKNPNLFITKEVHKKEGWDFYLSDKREARKVAREISRTYGAEVKESPQIAGRKDGQDLYRITFSVRLPEYRRGDVVEIEGRYCVVDTIDRHFLRVTELVSGRKKVVDSRRHAVKMVAERTQVEEMLVVYQEGDTVQLLTRDNRVIEARCREELPQGRYVQVVSLGGVVYVLPQSGH